MTEDEVAKAIHDALESDDDSEGGGYMRAAKAALAGLRSAGDVRADLAVAVEALERIKSHDGASYRYGDWVREQCDEALAKLGRDMERGGE